MAIPQITDYTMYKDATEPEIVLDIVLECYELRKKTSTGAQNMELSNDSTMRVCEGVSKFEDSARFRLRHKY